MKTRSLAAGLAMMLAVGAQAEPPPGLVLSRSWAQPTSLSAGGHSSELGDLSRLLSPYGQASQELTARADQKVSAVLTYLTPIAKVRTDMALSTLGSKSKIACAGFPDGLSFYSFSGSWGQYNRAMLVGDIADRLAAVEFVSETTSFVPPEMQNIQPLPGEWHVSDFVQARVKGQSGILIETRVKDCGDYLMINNNSVRLHSTATLFLPKPLVNLILYCTSRQPTEPAPAEHARLDPAGKSRIANRYHLNDIAGIRTNVVIDDDLIEAVQQARPGTTKKALVEEGRRLLLQLSRQQKILELRGKLKWEGDLEKMRCDAP